MKERRLKTEELFWNGTSYIGILRQEDHTSRCNDIAKLLQQAKLFIPFLVPLSKEFTVLGDPTLNCSQNSCNYQ